MTNIKNWKRTTIGDSYRFTSKPKGLSLPNKIKFIPMEALTESGEMIDKNRIKILSRVTSGTYVEDGDLVIAKITPSFENGKQGFVDLDEKYGYATTEVIPIKEINNVSDKFFLAYWLRQPSVRSLLAGKMEGTTGRQRLSKTILEKTEISLPPIDEQKAIVGVLTSIQDTLTAQRKLYAKLSELKSSMIERLFTFGVKHQEAKLTAIGEIPVGWNMLELGSVCDKPQYGFTDSASQKGNIKFLRITDITDKGVDWNSVPFCNCSNPEKYLLEDNDIVFARIGATTGKSYLIKNPPNAIYASYLIRIRPRTIDARYLYYFFQTQKYWRQIDSQKGTNLKGGVNGSVLSKLLIPVPSHKEQQIIAETCGSIDEKIKIVQEKIFLYTNLFQSLLSELMSGARRIKPTRKENKQNPKEVFKDAVIQSYIVKNLASPYVSHICLEKSTYFTKRFAGVSPISTYGTYTFGPYDPLNKYKGGLKLALNKKLIEPGDSWGYKPGQNISEIESYLYYSEINSAKKVLSKLKNKSDNELEILATVDFSIFDLLSKKIKPTADLILNFINSTEAWREKVARLKLDTTKVSKAMEELRKLASEGLPYPKLL